MKELENLLEKRTLFRRFETELTQTSQVKEYINPVGRSSFRIDSSFSDRTNRKRKVAALVTPCSDIASLPVVTRRRLLRSYKREFARPGSYMQHPDKGHVITFSIDDKQTGFFYFGENEIVFKDGVIPSVVSHIEDGLVQFNDLPEDLKIIFFNYLHQVGDVINLQDVGEEVCRPMRFYIYPELQGNGGLKVLLSLITIATALTNKNKKEIFQIIEARAGLLPGSKGSTSVVSDHQLVPLYLYKALSPCRSNGSGLLTWGNDPYLNASMGKRVDVQQKLSEMNFLG